MAVRSISLKHDPRRIALIKPSALGDIAHSLPVLSALRQRFPETHLSWIVNRGYAPILEGHPDLDAIIPFDRGALRKGLLTGSVAFTRFLRHLRTQRFDMVIDLQGLLRTGLMTLATEARPCALASRHRANSRRFATRIASMIVPACAMRSIATGASSKRSARRQLSRTFHVPVQADAQIWANEQLRQHPRPWLAVGVGSRWLTKRWPPEHFAALVRRAQTQFGGTAVFVGTPEEAALADQAATLVTGPTVQTTGKTTLPQLVALLSECDAMIANDTGPLHLAVALGRPVVAPYTCTLPDKTGPYGQDDRGIATSIWCRGSYLKTCPRMECMAELTPDRLWPPLENILRTWQQHHHAA